MAMMFYIVSYLTISKEIVTASYVAEVIGVIQNILPVLSILFLLYANSFVMRTRSKELGLYNILGMYKKNLSMILFMENTYAFVLSIFFGLILGIVFSKLAELLLVYLVNVQSTFFFSIDFLSVELTIVVFAAIFALLFFNELRYVLKTKAIDMMHSSSFGERKPKANWLLAVLGVLLLVCAYCISFKVKNSISALSMFTVAVIMVIVATYILFQSGSVAFCTLLQKNKKFYYKANHFVSISSMRFRMRRNGTGLASICILLTMILVGLSSTISIYIGPKDLLDNRYPFDFTFHASFDSTEDFNTENFLALQEVVNTVPLEKKDIFESQSISSAGYWKEDGFQLSIDRNAMVNYDCIGALNILSIEEYNQMMHEEKSLDDGECLLYTYRHDYAASSFDLDGMFQYHVKEVLPDFYINGETFATVVPAIYLVVPNYKEVVKQLGNMTNSWGKRMITMDYEYSFNCDKSDKQQIKLYNTFMDKLATSAPFKDRPINITLESRADNINVFYQLNGVFLFTGAYLSIMFIFVISLIIYYKQIMEGYEDRQRFEVMKKVGMIEEDIKKNVRTQVLLLFCFPLMMAFLHLAAASPLLWKLLQLFGVQNMKLIDATTVVVCSLTAIFYLVLYKVTSNVYYRIINGRNH